MNQFTNVKVLQQFIKDRIASGTTKRTERKKMKDYYDGKHAILQKEQKGNKPSNILLFNFPELIIEQNHSYLYGNPITYTNKVEDEKNNLFMGKMYEIYADNNEEKVTSSLGKTSSIYGQSVEYHYIDPDTKQMKFVETNPLEWSFFELDGEAHGLRSYTTTRYEIKGDGYEEVAVNKYLIVNTNTIYEYEEVDGKLVQITEKTHFYGEMPVIVYNNKSTIGSEGDSDLKNIISLVDGYNAIASNVADIVEGNADPFLLLINLGVSKEDVEEMRQSRTLKFRSQPGMQSEARYLTFEGNMAFVENFLETIVRKIFILSFTPDMFTKEGSMNGDSGLALQMKLAGSSDIKANGKQLAFKDGIRKRLRLIARQLENSSNVNYFSEGIFNNVEITFNKNIAQNLGELIEMAQKAMGIVSHQTVLQLLPFVEDPQDEIDRINREGGLPISLEDTGDE